MYTAVVLLVLGALTAFGIAHGSEPDPINLVITTHNPACTAAHLDYLGAVRLTDVKPWIRHGASGYTHNEIANGVNVTVIIWERDSNITIRSVLERPEVSGVAAYSRVTPNSTEAVALLAKYDNPDVKLPHMGHPTTCGLTTNHMLPVMMDYVGWGAAAPGVVSGYIPPSMLWSIIIRDDVSGIRESKLLAQERYGGADTEGPPVCEAAPGVAHVNKSDPAPVHLVVTTHNPVCTAAFLHHIEVTRLTDVRPLYRDGVRGYGADQYENGVNVTAIIWPQDAAKVMRAVAERTEVRGVAAYPYGAQNAAGPSPQLALAANPDVETPEFYGASTRCDVMPNLHLLQMFMDEVVGWNGAPDPVPRCAVIPNEAAESIPADLVLDPRPTDTRKDPESGIYYHDDLMRVDVWTSNVKDTWAHLQKNGALVIGVLGDGQPVSLVGAYMPVSLMWSIHERDGVWRVDVIQGSYAER